MDLFCGGKFSDRVSSEKLLAVSAAGPPAAFFPEIDMSGFFGHVPFWKKCDFAQIWSKYRPRYSKILSGSSQEAFRRPSGVPQEAVRRLSETICVSKALEQSWNEFCAETIMFFCRKWRDRVFCLHGSDVTCTKYCK